MPEQWMTPQERGFRDAFKGIRRYSREFRDDKLRHFCNLCVAGPCQSSAQLRQHEGGIDHRTSYRSYFQAHEEATALKAAKPMLLHVNRLKSSPFWIPSPLLPTVRDDAFGYMTGEKSVDDMNASWTRHVRRVYSDLITLAFTKAQIVALYPTMNQAREQSVMLEELGLVTDAASHWNGFLVNAELLQETHLFVTLVMPYIKETPLIE